MLYRVIGEATMIAHFAFIVFVMLGGFLAWRWRRVIWAHVIAVAWGVAAVSVGIVCPLTLVENWARREAGQAGLPPSGFIDHYLTGVIYPDDQVLLARAILAAAVLISWVGYIALRRRGRVPAGTPAV